MAVQITVTVSILQAKRRIIMDLTEYVDSELFIIIPVLYVIGIAIKKSEVNDKWIPLI